MDKFSVTYGVYDFNSFTRIDPFADNDITYTRFHELIHFNLTGSTIFGVTNYIVDQLSWRTKEEIIPLNKISEKLVKASVKVHEAVAVFYQYAMLKSIEGDDTYSAAIKELETNNKQYFNYVKSILFLLEEYKLEDILQSNIVYKMAMWSLNGDITKLPNNMLRKPGKLWNYFTHPVDGEKYNPNTRFKILIKSLKKLLNEYNLNEITDQLILNESNLKNTFNEDDFLENLKVWLFKELCTNKTKLVLEELLENSKTEQSLENYSEERLIEEYWNATHPTALNARYETLKKDFAELDFSNVCAIYLIPVEQQSEVILAAVNVMEGINYIDIMSEDKASEFLTGCKKKIIISHENYQVLKTNSAINIFLNKNFFVYVDIPYIRSDSFIEKNISIGKEIMLTQFGENLYHIIIKMKDKNGVIIIPLFDSALTRIASEIESGKYIPINNFENSVFFNNGLCTFCYEDIICATSFVKYWDKERVTFIRIK